MIILFLVFQGTFILFSIVEYQFVCFVFLTSYKTVKFKIRKTRGKYIVKYSEV